MQKTVQNIALSLCAGLFFSACSTNHSLIQPAPSFTNNHWELKSIEGKNIAFTKEQKAPFIIFESDSKVYGYDGCNRFFGSYKKEDSTLDISSLASTKMYCEETIKQADQFMNALLKTKGFNIQEEKLNLLDISQKQLLQFTLNPAPKE